MLIHLLFRTYYPYHRQLTIVETTRTSRCEPIGSITSLQSALLTILSLIPVVLELPLLRRIHRSDRTDGEVRRLTLGTSSAVPVCRLGARIPPWQVGHGETTLRVNNRVNNL